VLELTYELKNANEHLQLLTKLTKADPITNEARINPIKESAPVIEDKVSETERKKTEIEKEQRTLEEDIMKNLDIGGIEEDTEKIMDRLLKSVNMVKGVLQTNLKLRQQIIEMRRQLDQTNIDYSHVNDENEELKEKIIILETANELPQNKHTLANELCQLKKKKLILEQHLQNLERENINIRITKNESMRLVERVGTDDFEPVRSVINTKYGLKTNKKRVIHNGSKNGMVKTTYSTQKMSSNFLLYVKVHSCRY